MPAEIIIKQERDSDRAVVCEKHAIVSFDLENVISLPKANIKSFWFNRKLSVYNLAVQYSVGQANGRICVIWYEGIRGRSGNDIASSSTRLYVTGYVKRAQSVGSSYGKK